MNERAEKYLTRTTRNSPFVTDDRLRLELHKVEVKTIISKDIKKKPVEKKKNQKALSFVALVKVKITHQPIRRYTEPISLLKPKKYLSAWSLYFSYKKDKAVTYFKRRV